MWRRANLFLTAICLACLMAACSNPAPERTAASAPTATNANASLNKNDYPVFPDADAGADSSVPAEQGGKGFKGEGWETNTDFDLIGDPRAVKGGVLRDVLDDFPANFRLAGPQYNSAFNYGITAMAYETLLAIDYKTLKYIPSLATHWQVSPDQMTYRFRINPNARFSDGTPVTSEDVVASYDFQMDKTLQSPSGQMTFGKMERPVAESKYIVSVKAKQLNWRNLLYFGGDLQILPAHLLKDVNGEKYLKDYNYKLLPGTGPYTIKEGDFVKGKSITVRRRPDYWAWKARANIGLYNFDELRFVVVRDENLVFEMFKKGDLDYYIVPRAKIWVEDTNFENIQRGLIQKRKIFNNQPWGFVGFAMNTRRAPFDDIRVRKAFTLLANRKLMIEKLAYNEYVPLNSLFPDSVYENSSNPKNPYDPEQAIKLLADAGWKDHDSQGRLIKNGQPLQIEMLYATKTMEPYLTVYQEDLRKLGITLNLRLVTPETQFQMTSEHRFEMTYTGFGGLTFPNPETSLSSKSADEPSGNNITGFKNARVDELCNQYDKMFNVDDRIRAIREIDGMVSNDYQYVLLWTGPFTRVLYWNKFGTPPGYFSRTGAYFGDQGGPGIPQMWWIDSSKLTNLEQALRDPSIKLEVGPVEDRYWMEFDKKSPTSSPQEKSH